MSFIMDFSGQVLLYRWFLWCYIDVEELVEKAVGDQRKT